MSDEVIPNFDDEGGQNGNSYDTLEESIFKTERNHDKEITKGVRLEKWQYGLINTICREIGTNTVEVVLRAYVEGVKEIRDEFGEDAKDLSTIFMNINRFLEDLKGRREYIEEVEGQIHIEGIKDPRWGERDLREGSTFYLPKSVVSEVNKFYVEWCGFGGWIHRTIIGFGLRKSEFAGQRTKEKFNEEIESIRVSIGEDRKNLERGLAFFCDLNTSYWINNGVDDETVEMLEESVSSMDTKYRDRVANTIETIKEYR